MKSDICRGSSCLANHSPMSASPDILIVGAGIFGLSTALAYDKRHPEFKIVVIDRFEPPVPDGSSVDTTRCIRFDYTNGLYAELAHRATEVIKRDHDLAPLFHQVGMSFVFDGKTDKWGSHWNSQLENIRSVTENFTLSESPEKVFYNIHGSTNGLSEGNTKWNQAYTNFDAGFIEADNAMRLFYQKCRGYSQIAFQFSEVRNIVFEPGTSRAKGVQLNSGESLAAKLVVIAAGAWSAKLVDLRNVISNTCIEVAWLDVTEAEEAKWRDMSITTNLSTGVNIFPPLRREIKVLRRSPGYKNTVEVPNPEPWLGGVSTISFPRTQVLHPEDWMPAEAERELRLNLEEIMPSLANRPFSRTKMCWLTQTKTANFLIDFHPALQNVLLVTGGSAHAWKFLPVIGDKVVELVDGRLEQDLRELWSWKDKETGGDNGSAARMDG